MATMIGGSVSVVTPELDEKPWGGRGLAELGLALPDGARVGEARITPHDARILSGVGAGSTLGNVVLGDPERRLGRHARAVVGGRPIFPLLVKLIDACENLSIQVHPNDEQAAAHNRLGKTEAWHVLAAKPGSWLYAGLRDGVSIEAFLKAAARLDGSSASLLRRIPAQPGTTILLPAGTVHALGAGVMVYEIQQPSDLTYRLDDWGRVDAEGNPRQMHRDAGAAALQAELRPELIAPVELPANEGRRHLLAACNTFALERVALPGGGRFRLEPIEGPQVVTVLSGKALPNDQQLMTGHSAVIWPGSPRATLEVTQPTVLLRGWVPSLKDEFGALASTPGVDPSGLDQLSGPLPDMQEALRA